MAREVSIKVFVGVDFGVGDDSFALDAFEFDRLVQDPAKVWQDHPGPRLQTVLYALVCPAPELHVLRDGHAHSFVEVFGYHPVSPLDK